MSDEVSVSEPLVWAVPTAESAASTAKVLAVEACRRVVASPEMVSEAAVQVKAMAKTEVSVPVAGEIRPAAVGGVVSIKKIREVEATVLPASSVARIRQV